MTKNTTLVALAMLASVSVMAQQKVDLHNAEVIQMRFLGETQPARSFNDTQGYTNEVVRNLQGLQIEHEELENKGLHLKTNPNALPLGPDPVLQDRNGSRSNGNRGLDQTFDGLPSQALNPADPCLDVGPNHVIQMINASSGSYFQIYSKTGATLAGPTFLDNFVGSAGGAGDPIVLYDAIADRWLMSEFASSGNHLLVAVSTTADPTGTWYAYDFTTPNFPDYPKYSVWNDMYMVTSNEGTGCPIYALDRTNMLAGLAATSQRFTTPDYPSIGFQATTPITFDGSTLPPAGAPAMLMRMADDGWTTAIPNDRLEIWTLTVDFNTPANSVLSGPSYLAVSPFDTELCGYTSFSCIDQAGSTTNLDPLRELIMNRAQYRNFGTHETIVCNHVTDVDNTDHAGVRWYELRRTGGIAQPWVVYQEGTYAPDSQNRWMAAISINNQGDIGLSYSVAGSTTYPSLRYTGRSATDPLGTMTVAETSIVAGTVANGSNRWGDYFSLDTDPSDGSFWGTGCYNTSSSWKTRVYQFSFSPPPPDYSLDVTNTTFDACQPSNATNTIQVGSSNGFSGPVTLSTSGLPAGLSASFSPNPVTPAGSSTMTISNTGSVAQGTYNFTVNASASAGNKSVPVTLILYTTPAQVVATAPANGATGIPGSALLSWNATGAGDLYELQVSTNAGMTAIVETAAGISGTSHQTTTATAPLTTYYWRVRAVNPCNTGAYSTVRSYTTSECIPLSIQIVLDRYGSETTWSLENASNVVMASGGPYVDNTVNGAYPQPDVNVCVPAGCYDLIVNDSYGDGICCAFGNGIFTVVDGENHLLAEITGDIDVNIPAVVNFCVPFTCKKTFPYSDDLELGLGDWKQSTTDDFNWTLDAGGTPSTNTGPSADHTTGTTTGNYMYTEASNPNFPSQTAIITSQCFDLSSMTGATLTFWYHMYGADMGSLHLDILQGTTVTSDVWTLSGDQGNSWQQATVDLATFLSGEVSFSFRGITGSDATNGYLSDMALDDIMLTVSSGVKLAANVILDGPYVSGTGLMSDALRSSSMIPTTEPYTLKGYSFVGGGGETIAPTVLTISGNDAVVDWVVVELRNAADNTSIVASRCALLQRDGDIVDLDGTSDVTIAVGAGNYFVAVRHRNHLGVMAMPAVAMSASAVAVDLTSTSTNTFGTLARKNVSGVEVLWSGDVTFNGEVKYTGTGNDRDPILQSIGGSVPTNTTAGYGGEDVNMDGVKKYTGTGNDRDPILQNIGGSIPTAIRIEQLP